MKQHGSDLISECLNGQKLSAKVFSAWDEADFDEAPSQPDAKPTVMLDEKELTEWAKTCLEQKMSNLTVKLFGGSACASFHSPEVFGEVSVTRTGNEVVADFRLRLDSSWTI